jgi:hypothetical protein
MRMRFATTLAAVFFVACTAWGEAAPAPGGGLDALLAKARAASGAPYRYHIVSRSREVHDGKTFDVTTETEGLKYRARSCAQDICTGFFFDGERSYDTNFNDTALPLSSGVDGLQLTLRAIASYAFTDPAFRKNGGTLVERDPVSRNGLKYRRVSVAPRLGALLDAVIDPQSGLVVGVISDERKYAFEFDDQREIDGKVTLPFSISLNGEKFTLYRDRSIVEGPLEAPAGLVPDLSAGEATVPMTKLSRAGVQPVVPCTIGGQAASCLLDTGDSGLSMSLELVEKLGIEPIAGTFDVHGIGQYVTGVVRAPALTVGGAVYPGANYVVLHDLAQYGCDAILGADVFAHARITLDFGKREVHIAPSAGNDGSGIALTFENFVPVVPIGLGDSTVPLQIDTGDDGTIDLDYEYYEAHQSLFKPSGATAVNGIGGNSEGVAGTIPRVRIASFDVAQEQIGATKKISYNGHVGTGLLDHFVVTLDYRRALLELVPRPGDRSVTSAAAAQ